MTDDEAAFTVIGSIGLQGIRLLNPQLGETIVVTGLGLIGLIVAQLLKANGCNVIGIDFDQQKVDMATSKGIVAINPTKGVDPVKLVEELTNDIGADGVIITASNKSDEIIHQACEMSRKRGRIILVGVIGLNMRRDDFYKKELTFQVSCSYGAGCYDEEYENKGHDHPLAYVRWTEKRNFETILNTIAVGGLDVKSLITESVDLKDYLEIYGDMRKQGSIASIIKFPEEQRMDSVVAVDGKSFVAANLAISYAEVGKKVILIDADMRGGRQGKLFNIPNNLGLSNFLSNLDPNGVEINELVNKFINETAIKNLNLITSGTVPPNSNELLTSTKLVDMIKDLSVFYDVVIIDGTPILTTKDSLILTRVVSSTACYAGEVRKEQNHVSFHSL